MKPVFLFLLSVAFFFAHAQTSNTIKTTAKPTATTAAKTSATPPSTNTTKSTVAPKTNTPKQPAGLQEYVTKNKGGSASTPNPNAKPFPFTGSFTMNFEIKETNAKPNSGKIKYAFDGYLVSLIPTFSNTVKTIAGMNTIINSKDDEMMNLTVDMKGKKSGLLLKLPKQVISKDTTIRTPKAIVIKKTNESKVIEGYKCEKYVIDYTDTSKIVSWVTNDIALNSSDLLKLINMGFRGKSPFSKTNLSDIKGTALETIITKKDGSSTKITITEISKKKPDAVVFSYDGYNVADARSIPMFGGN
ncbi:MAG: DUF4412 domain-containing protein [Sphingobacteriales bacterium]|nr:DUF4412 domain-containing protein [Sphingobacteriales bacterium]